ncbi:MAG: cation diffusion facilitator family transporter [Candidatus Gastranaerophilales bacterium]|nr:cation diffusion facilitator family transporter [Candidatus Gastranaerophilales bacterium]
MTSDSIPEQAKSETPEQVENKSGNVNLKFRAVVRAFLANIFITIIKFASWYFTKSSAMFAEAIHSGVDSFNSICLMIGLKRGSRPADGVHPFGHGLETNVWTIIACILMFFGAAVSLLSAYNKIFNNNSDDVLELLNNYHGLAIILVLSICFESWAVHSAVNAVIDESGLKRVNPFVDFIKSIKYVHKINTPTTKYVWYEDVVALTGVVVAFIAVSISKLVLPLSLAHIPDGIASGIIALMLLFLAGYMLKNNVNLLTGLSAEPQVEEVIKQIAENLHCVSCVKELKTMNMGTSGLIVNIKIEVDPDMQVKEADDISEMVERKIREHFKNISHISIEIDSDDAEENWEDKFDKIIQEGEKIEVIDDKEANMLSNFYSFAQTVVKEIMVPRPKVIFVDAEDNLDTLMDLIIDSGHTRIPVYEGTVDNLIGVINAKDALKALRDKTYEQEGFEIKSLAREILIIPENKFISDLLNDFTTTKNQIAAVVDEHGGIAGIVTVEDIIEEIVGEIYDEFDESPIPEIIKVDDNTLNISSLINIDDINETYDLDIPNEDFQTIGGYVFGLLGREPEIGDVVEDKNLSFEVTELDVIRSSRVIMRKNTPFISKSKEEEKDTNETL